MRIALAIIPLALLGACQVSKDDANGTASVTYNSDVAENAAADVGNTLENVASDIGNDVQKTGDKIENKVGNTDVKVNANVTTRRATCTPTTRVHSINAGIACTCPAALPPDPKYCTQNSRTQRPIHGICTTHDGSGGGPLPAEAATSRAIEIASRPATTPP